MKLVAEVGVGTVAAGVAKAGADHILISGHDGGTGASPLSSLQAAGSPWEIGLAETQQTLMMNDLRSRVWVQADGQMKTGRDVVIAALLGADEVGFSTAPLIAAGCIMMRACHLNTCPVGIATQDPELRRRFEGTPEHVVNYLFFVAEEARELMAKLGIRAYDDLIGRVELLEFAPAVDHWKARGLDLSLLLAAPAEGPADAPRRRITSQLSPLPGALDWDLIEAARDAIDHRKPVTGSFRIRNVHRTVGGLLSHWVAKVHGAAGLPPETVRFRLDGSAGQSFGAWLAPGVELSLVGDANDYCGKGLSGGVIAIRPPDGATFAAEENVIVGNTVLYGATAGRAFFRGLAGERFAVRNSGASAVAEGVGDHGCEYMTGGRVVILGPTGRNFAAGMSGGIAYVHDPARHVRRALQHGPRRLRRDRRGGCDRAPRARSRSTTCARSRRWPRGSSRTGTRRSRGSSRSCRTTTSARWPSRRRPSGRCAPTVSATRSATSSASAHRHLAPVLTLAVSASAVSTASTAGVRAARVTREDLAADAAARDERRGDAVDRRGASTRSGSSPQAPVARTISSWIARSSEWKRMSGSKPPRSRQTRSCISRWPVLEHAPTQTAPANAVERDPLAAGERVARRGA